MLHYPLASPILIISHNLHFSTLFFTFKKKLIFLLATIMMLSVATASFAAKLTDVYGTKYEEICEAIL